MEERRDSSAVVEENRVAPGLSPVDRAQLALMRFQTATPNAGGKLRWALLGAGALFALTVHVKSAGATASPDVLYYCENCGQNCACTLDCTH